MIKRIVRVEKTDYMINKQDRQHSFEITMMGVFKLQPDNKKRDGL